MDLMLMMAIGSVAMLAGLVEFPGVCPRFAASDTLSLC